MEQYNLPTHTKGDTFVGVTFTVLVNNIAVDLTDAVITLQLRLTQNHPTVQELSSTAGNIEITDATAGEFQIKQQVINFTAGIYFYDIEMRWPNGVVKTYIGGKWTILQDITH